MQLSILGRCLGRLFPDLETLFELALACKQTNKQTNIPPLHTPVY